MQPEFWHERWSQGHIGFHQPATERFLGEYWTQATAARRGHVFVPLCGKSLDLLWLRDRGYHVTGVELSDIAVQAFFLENGIAARRRVTPAFDVYEAANLELLRGDFFDLTAARLDPVAAVYDRAALISWSPELRAPYVEHMTALTPAGATTLLITLEYRQAKMPGPPFSVDRHEVVRLYSRDHEVQELARRDILAIEPRMQARGVSELVEVCYGLVRRSH
jgi:thiopurine S-methyltransferase